MTIFDVDPTIRKHRPIVTPDIDRPAPHEGPPLIRRKGHFKFKDILYSEMQERIQDPL